MRPIAAGYDELCDDALATLDYALEDRAIARAERRLTAQLEGRTASLGGVACGARVIAGAIVLGTSAGLVRVLRVERPEDLVLAARLLDLPPEAVALLESVGRGRARRRLLLERVRLRIARRAVARRRRALGDLREGEVAEAEKRRRHLAARERRRGVAVEPSLARAVPVIVSDAARALADEARSIDAAIGRCGGALAETESIRGREDALILDGFAALSRLIAERIALEYRRFERALLRDLRAFAEGAPEGGADVPSPVPQASRRGALGDLRLVHRLAFLMSKANFVPVPRRDLERGFAIGPSPGLRLTVPLDQPAAAHFFARGVHMEPLSGGGLAPRFERFAYCWLERPPSGRAASARPRKRAASGFLGRLRRRLRVALLRDARRRIAPSVRRAVDLARTLAAAPATSAATAAPPMAIKIFADVRLGECGLLLPGAAIRYRARDLMLVLGGVLGGIWSKISASPLALLLTPRIALPLFGVAAFRGLMGMRRSRVTLDKLREEYENRHLLATRLHAVDYFVREAAETDAKEALLAYGTALVAAVERDDPPAAILRQRACDLRSLVEARLGERAQRVVRFDIEDAIGCLEACGLVMAPGFFAPEDETPDFFDPRVTGETVKRDAATLFEAAPGPEARVPAPPLAGEAALRDALERLEGRRPSPPRDEAPDPPAGGSPEGASGAPAGAPTPIPGADPEGPREADATLAREVVLLPIEEAVRRLRADLRRRLDLEDTPLGTGFAHGVRGDIQGLLGERFTL